ncbi:MAG: imidazolonepropionase [Candidatus Sericytochromatia bacterium]
MDLNLIHINELVSCQTPGFEGPLPPSRMNEIVILQDAYLRIRDGAVLDFGSMDSYDLPEDGIPQQDLSGCTVTPGLVDPHTHLVFAGSREHELVERIERKRNLSKGQRMSGGINYTVGLTREAPPEVLLALALQRLDRMLAHGTTTAEAKSGYGLDLASELKLLEVIRQADARHPIDLVPTFLGAHAVPAGQSMEAYVAEVLAMIPQVAQRGLAEFCDVFCEEGFFSVEDSRRILKLAHSHGLRLKVHADELAASGGAALAAELGAVSADHLQFAPRSSLEAMKAAGTLPVLLPGTAFYLGLPYADTTTMRDLDLAMAISTDLNPGGCYCESQLFMIVLACTQMQMLPIEALVGATRNAAWAIDRGQQAGTIAPGRPADLLVLHAPNHAYLPYHFGVNLVRQVYKQGRACLADAPVLSL